MMIYEDDNQYIGYRALSSRVLAVVVVNKRIGDWAAYINAVPDKSHDREFIEASRTGEKLPVEIARILFPEEAGKYRWRD